MNPEVTRGLVGPARRAAQLVVLTQLIGRGNSGALGDFYDETSRYVYGVALTVLRSPQLAATATEQVYAEVWRRAAQFDPAEGSALCWLMAMAHRIVADHVRAGRSGALPEQSAVVTGPEFDRTAGEGGYSRDAELARQAVRSLSDHHRQAVTLAYFGGCSQQEVARILGLSLEDVKTRIRGGLVSLREAMGAER